MGFFNEFPHTRTYDNDLGWIIKHVGSYDETIKALNDWIEINTPKIEDLETFKNELESGHLPAGVEKAIHDWCSTHVTDLLGSGTKNVFFGLTDSGYFAAYIPDSWDDITFNTSDYDIYLEDRPDVDYGHLILSY